METTVIDYMIGRTAKKVSVLEDEDQDMIVFHFTDGTFMVFCHRQECCENVYIDDICGSLDDLIGEPLIIAEENTSYDEGGAKDEYDDSYTWTFYKFATKKGYVDIRWYGSSNGYYSEDVEHFAFDESLSLITPLGVEPPSCLSRELNNIIKRIKPVRYDSLEII